MAIEKPEIGDFVETIHGVNGILTAIKPTCYGDMAFIATADMRTFHCPVTDIINKNGTQPQGGGCMSELKPCPFCGGEARYHQKPAPKIQCGKCQAKICGAKFRPVPRGYDDYLAGLWNRRYTNENPETRQG